MREKLICESSMAEKQDMEDKVDENVCGYPLFGRIVQSAKRETTLGCDNSVLLRLMKMNQKGGFLIPIDLSAHMISYPLI